MSDAVADLYVVRVGEGEFPRSDRNQFTYVERLSNAGAPLGTIALPGFGPSAFTLSGTEASEGTIRLSADGRFLTLAGYAAEVGVVDVDSQDSELAPRGVARIEIATGIVDATTRFTADSTFSYVSPRSAVSSNGNDLWVAGATGGVRYASLGGNGTVALTGAPNLNYGQSLSIFQGQLYASSNYAASAANSLRGVLSVGSGLPTSGPQTAQLLLPASATRSSHDFWFRDDSTLYIADYGTAANGGGIQKWSRSGANWSLQYTLLNSGATTTAVRGLAGTVVDGEVVLYATTTEVSRNKLIRILDLGSQSNFTVLATAPTFTVFRGVEYVADASLSADFNLDGQIDGADFLKWQRDGADATKLQLWKDGFGTPAVAATPVPEPATTSLIGFGTFALPVASRLAGKRRGAGAR